MQLSNLADLISLSLLLIAIAAASLALRGFKQSKRAITESASLVTVIVGALTSRIESSESILDQLRSGYDFMTIRQNRLEEQASSAQSGYNQFLDHVQQLLDFDKRFVSELELLKLRFIRFSQSRTALNTSTRNEIVLGKYALDSLTLTEREVFEILRQEGAKAAPELGQRLNKSREHMARLMKKLYLEGYVDREANRTPFRYRLSEKLLSTIQAGEPSIPAASET